MAKYDNSYSIHKTRKDHKCYNCGGIIPKGDRARYTNQFDGTKNYYHIGKCIIIKHCTKLEGFCLDFSKSCCTCEFYK